MAFTEFCCRSGGSNLNAGTRDGSSTEPGTTADFTYASGNWVASTGVFTVASGDPASDGVAVGDFASVYADGSTETGFVGRVTARDATTITVSLSAKAGTAPTDGTGDRTLKIGGAWQGPNGASGFPYTIVGFALKNTSNNELRINIKNESTYNVTAAITNTIANGPFTVQGYTASYGDGGKFTLDGGGSGSAYVLLSLQQTGVTLRDAILNRNGATGSATGLSVTGVGCRIEGVVCSNMRGLGIFVLTGGSVVLRECEVFGSASTGGIRVNATAGSFVARCISHDNAGYGFAATSTNFVFTSCIADSNTSDGFIATGTGHFGIFSQCDSYNNGGDGIETYVSNTVENCNLIKNGGWGILGTGALLNSGICSGVIRNNGFGSGSQANTSGATSGIEAMEVSGSLTYAANDTPWVDPANGDFRISLAAAKNAGRGVFTQTAPTYAGTISYPDIGAAQAAAAGGGVRIPNIRGGADQ